LVCSPPDGTINLATEAAAELFNIPLERLVGSNVFDYVEPRAATERAANVLASGDADGLSGVRQLRRAGLAPVPVQFWTRVIELDAKRRVVVIFLPHGEVVARLGPDPAAPWRGLVPIAVGLADQEWHIAEVSEDISNIVARTPTDLVGSQLLALFHREDVATLDRGESAPPGVDFRHVRLTEHEVSGDEVTLMLAPWDTPATPIIFAIVGTPDGEDEVTADRIFDLEMRLRRIGAEVRAAGVLDALDALPRIEDHPKLGELTTRQQEVLGMLLQGLRVAMIASQLYVSQSTVRNHLATIFHKFGVHSQAELLELLTPRPSSEPGGPNLQRTGSGDGRS
jgi:DNA-binding CsgD family transcriptional regulator